MTYLEFFDAVSGGTSNLIKRTQIAVVSWGLATSILPANAPNREAKGLWATSIFQDPKDAAIKTLWFAIATMGIQGDGSAISDPVLQTAVNSISDQFYAQAVLLPNISSIIKPQTPTLP